MLTFGVHLGQFQAVRFTVHDRQRHGPVGDTLDLLFDPGQVLAQMRIADPIQNLQDVPGGRGHHHLARARHDPVQHGHVPARHEHLGPVRFQVHINVKVQGDVRADQRFDPHATQRIAQGGAQLGVGQFPQCALDRVKAISRPTNAQQPGADLVAQLPWARGGQQRQKDQV